MRCAVIAMFTETVLLDSCSCSGGGGGGAEIRFNCLCISVCDFSDKLIPISSGDGSIEFTLDIEVPSFEVVESLWLSFALGIGMSTKHIGSFIPFDVCASLIWFKLASTIGASTEIIIKIHTYIYMCISDGHRFSSVYPHNK